MNSIPVLEFDHVGFAYPHGPKVLDDISFSIRSGEKVGVVGLNGSGKSTLLLHTNALLHPSTGFVAVNGVTITKKNEQEARRAIGMVFQNSDDQLFMPTVEADVSFGPKNMGLSDSEIEERVNEALGATGCLDLKKRSSLQLSGGQKRMVSVATVLSMHPEILVLDEPTCGLDYAAETQLRRILNALPHTILLASHDLQLIKEQCNRVIILEEGRIKYDGLPDEMPYPPEYK